MTCPRQRKKAYVERVPDDRGSGPSDWRLAVVHRMQAQESDNRDVGPHACEGGQDMVDGAPILEF